MAPARAPGAVVAGATVPRRHWTGSPGQGRIGPSVGSGAWQGVACAGGRRKAAAVEDVRVCRSCGHIDPANSIGRCPTCGLFFELAIVPRPEAERLARRRRRSIVRRRLLRLLVAFALVGGVTAWAVRVFFDLGLSPPRATTSISASIEP